MSEKENRNKNISLFAKNDKEIISIVASESNKEMTVIRQSVNGTSRDAYRLERIDDRMTSNKKSTKLCGSKSCTFNTDGSFIIQNQSDHYLE